MKLKDRKPRWNFIIMFAIGVIMAAIYFGKHYARLELTPLIYILNMIIGGFVLIIAECSYQIGKLFFIILFTKSKKP